MSAGHVCFPSVCRTWTAVDGFCLSGCKNPNLKNEKNLLGWLPGTRVLGGQEDVSSWSWTNRIFKCGQIPSSVEQNPNYLLQQRLIRSPLLAKVKPTTLCLCSSSPVSGQFAAETWWSAWMSWRSRFRRPQLRRRSWRSRMRRMQLISWRWILGSAPNPTAITALPFDSPGSSRDVEYLFFFHNHWKIQVWLFQPSNCGCVMVSKHFWVAQGAGPTRNAVPYNLWIVWSKRRGLGLHG